MSFDVLGIVIALVASQGVNVAIVRSIVRGEIAKLNGTYRRSEQCEAIHEKSDYRLDRIDDQARFGSTDRQQIRRSESVHQDDTNRRLDKLEH